MSMPMRYRHSRRRRQGRFLPCRVGRRCWRLGKPIMRRLVVSYSVRMTEYEVEEGILECQIMTRKRSRTGAIWDGK